MAALIGYLQGEMRDFGITLKKLNGRIICSFDVPCRVSSDGRPCEQDVINRIVELGYNPLLYTYTVNS